MLEGGYGHLFLLQKQKNLVQYLSLKSHLSSIFLNYYNFSIVRWIIFVIYSTNSIFAYHF